MPSSLAEDIDCGMKVGLSTVVFRSTPIVAGAECSAIRHRP